MSFSQLDTLQSTVEMLNLSNVYTGDPDQYDRRWSRLEAMTTSGSTASTPLDSDGWPSS